MCVVGLAGANTLPTCSAVVAVAVDFTGFSVAISLTTIHSPSIALRIAVFTKRTRCGGILVLSTIAEASNFIVRRSRVIGLILPQDVIIRTSRSSIHPCIANICFTPKRVCRISRTRWGVFAWDDVDRDRVAVYETDVVVGQAISAFEAKFGNRNRCLSS